MSYIKLRNTKKKIIALVDCNSFYVSCERLFNPILNRFPVVVLSNNDGCVISRSKEAKEIGIRMGEPYFKVKELVKKYNVKVFSSNYALYGDISRRVMSTLKRFSPNIEFYSIDEAFLDLTDLAIEDINQYIHELRKIILKWTGIPVSIGVASTKTLSKVANHVAKKNLLGTQHFIGENEKYIDCALKKFPVGDVWGVGRQLNKLYQKNNIKNAFDLKNCDNTWVRKNTNVFGLKTVMELRGISCIDFDLEEDRKRKNCCVSRSFGKKVKEFETLKEALISHCLNAAEKIRLDRQIVKSIVVFIKTSPFDKSQKYFSRSKTIDLPFATDNSLELSKACLNALEKIFVPGYKYQTTGVLFCGLRDKNNYKTNLFENKNIMHANSLMKAIDKTNFRFGRNVITTADTGFRNNWKMRRNHSSRIDTSSFEFLPNIKAI